MQKEAIIITFNIASQGERARAAILSSLVEMPLSNDNAILSGRAGPDGMEYSIIILFALSCFKCE